MKSLFALAALGASLVMPVSFAQAQTDYGAPGYHSGYRAESPGRYDVQPNYGGGTVLNNTNCPAGSVPHVWPNGNGYRCFPIGN